MCVGWIRAKSGITSTTPDLEARFLKYLKGMRRRIENCTETVFKEKHGVWDPTSYMYAGVDYNLTLCRLQS